MFNRFFAIVDTCFICEDTARQSCAMVQKWRFFASCIFSQPRAARFRHAFEIRTKATPVCGSMVNIQSRTAEIRRGIKKEEEVEDRNHRAKI